MLMGTSILSLRIEVMAGAGYNERTDRGRIWVRASMDLLNIRRVKIGVVGLGRFGRLHALTLARLAEADLVALVARRQASLDALVGELPGVPGWTDLERAIQESGAEAWVVACTTAAHVPVARALLVAGKTVLLEKPIADNLEEASTLAPLVRADSSNLMLGHIVLFNSEYQQLREEVVLRGSLAFIDCVRHRPASIVSDFPGENPLHAAMVHDLYATQVLVNRAEPVHVSAQFHRTRTGQVDLALAQLQWTDGPIAAFASSYLTPSGMAPRGFDRMEVFGAGWSARISPNPRPIEVWGERASWPLALEIRTDAVAATGMMAEELRCFCRVVRGLQGVPVGATYADAMQVQRWMDRLEACAAS
jgi:predicted dehydrogenase